MVRVGMMPQYMLLQPDPTGIAYPISTIREEGIDSRVAGESAVTGIVLHTQANLGMQAANANTSENGPRGYPPVFQKKCRGANKERSDPKPQGRVPGYFSHSFSNGALQV